MVEHESSSRTVIGDCSEGLSGHLLEVDEVVRVFGGVAAVNRATFHVGEGSLTSLIGPNGAGKSTMIGLIAGAVSVTSGTIRFMSQDITHLRMHRVARLGIIRTYQVASVFERLTVLENVVVGAAPQRGERLAVALGRRRRWREEEAHLAQVARGVLSRFELGNLENRYAGELSGGQRRIIEVLRALMAKPRLLLLDEPMAGVHPGMRRQIEALLIEICAQGTAILMVEHELDVVERIADSIIVMTQGSVLRQGVMADIRRDTEVQRAYLVG